MRHIPKPFLSDLLIRETNQSRHKYFPALLKLGVSIPKTSGLMYHAVRQSSVDVVRLLLEYGIDSVEKSYWGSAVEKAAFKGSRDIVELLVQWYIRYFKK